MFTEVLSARTQISKAKVTVAIVQRFLTNANPSAGLTTGFRSEIIASYSYQRLFCQPHAITIGVGIACACISSSAEFRRTGCLKHIA